MNENARGLDSGFGLRALGSEVWKGLRVLLLNLTSFFVAAGSCHSQGYGLSFRVGNLLKAPLVRLEGPHRERGGFVFRVVGGGSGFENILSLLGLGSVFIEGASSSE